MNQFPWLTVIGLIPLVGAVVLWLLPASLADRAKHIALGASLVTLVFAVAAALQFSTSSTSKFQLVGDPRPGVPAGRLERPAGRGSAS